MTTPLPGPVLIYDGGCAFCRRWVTRFKRWEKGDRVRLLPLQDPHAPVTAGRTPAQLMVAMCFVRADGRAFDGADAARELTRFIRWGWLARFGLSLPGAMALARRVYAWVAGRRNQIGCGGDHCSLPLPPADPPG